MLKKLTAIVVAVILVMSQTVFCKTQEQVIENAMKFTVMVTNEGFTGSGARGSGVLLNETTVLTCFHMLEAPDDTLYIYTYPFGQVIKAHPDMVDRARDIAFLKLETPVRMRVKPVFQTKVALGEHVYAIGNALGAMQWTVSSGIISAKERGFILTDMQINPGNSGGPWINEKGEIVGLTDWRIGPMKHIPGIAGAIDGKVLYDHVDDYLHPEKLMARFMAALFGVSVSTEAKHK